jgi:ferredoxin-NADP reductase/ferredoxin
MNNHLIILTTHDGQQLQFDCREDEDVISAAERQSIVLPQQCRSGACSLCTATLIKGDSVLTNYNKEALSDEQRAQQQTLLCCTYPRSTLHITTDYDYQAIHFGKTPEAQFTITGKQALTTQVIHLILQQTTEMDNLLSAKTIAGQYMQLMPLDKSIKRAYSIANPANWQGQLEFLIQLQPQGQFSQFLQTAAIGETLIASGPQGDFCLHENGLKPRWFIAGHTGLAQILAMLKQMADFGEMHPAHLFFGLRYEEDIFFEPELVELQKILPQFRYQICVSRAKPDWNKGYQGSVLHAVEAALKNMNQIPDIYLCGSNRLVDGMLALFKTYQIEATGIYYERFSK